MRPLFPLFPLDKNEAGFKILITSGSAGTALKLCVTHWDAEFHSIPTSMGDDAMRMKMVFWSLLFVSSVLFIEDSFAQGDLKITNLNIVPMPHGVQGPTMQLHMSGSYRVEVSIQRGGAGQQHGFPCFTVRTECVRSNQSITLGEARIGVAPSSGWGIYAVYDIYPSSAGGGNCLLRTIVDANNEVAEPDESPVSNIWDRNAIILP